MGGKWLSTNPKAEQAAMKHKNDSSNGLLFDTCKHFRRVRNDYYSSYYLAGIVIDSFIYVAMNNWHWIKDGETSISSPGDYENILFSYLKTNTSWEDLSLITPGSNISIDTSCSIACLEKVMRYIAE